MYNLDRTIEGYWLEMCGVASLRLPGTQGSKHDAPGYGTVRSFEHYVEINRHY